MAKRTRIWLVICLLAGLLAVGLVVFFTRPAKPQPAPLPSFQPKATEPAVPPRTTDSADQPANPQQQSPEIVVQQPTRGDTIGSGAVVKGSTTVADESLQFRLKGRQSGQLVAGGVSVGKPGSSPRSFSFPLVFVNQAVPGDQAVLQVFTTAADGSIEASTLVEVTLQ